uniref:Uncharacterized protein n=1 Tax=Rhizophora mucronata TaxID=61149 RepID=A0A2P2KJP5_RHIMU
MLDKLHFIAVVDDVTEITSMNRPKDAFFDWFLNPFIIMKDQIRALNLSDSEENYLCKLVLLNGDPIKLKSSSIGPPPESERRRAELDALARRLQGIVKSISRYPTSRRNFQVLVKNLSEDLSKKNGDGVSESGYRTIGRSKSAFDRMFSQKSFKYKTSNNVSDQDSRSAIAQDVEIV